ncbi:hypothetical protein GYMLUDRAFT_242126 [Collybiopsis luxurians FD-317 M1]|uniref:Alpha-type protein kinase domain-containing protein n=1 Tax=Collybiopsis luxurians FD-317 M1 TaxID=944289 RepID=A0A0D0CJS1_9AGAR|nr:hypothetical protein GYMLUDRAFT_242126 [Collybiopsis luxurians FD-317 M1]
MPSMRAPIVSSFSAVATSFTVVVLHYATITQNQEDFKHIDVTVTWPEQEGISAKLDDKPFSSGNVKEAFNLKLQDSPDLYVAKHLFNPSTLNSRMNASSPAKNTQELEFEAQCLYYVKFFLDWFIKEARHHLDVTPVWLAKEVHSTTFPTPAAGISLDEIGSITNNEEDADITISWLIEPRRTNAVRKYSGTNIHVQHSGKMGSILTAFAHFTYQASNGMFVLADIQTCIGKNANSVLCELLFDIGIHSSNK